MAYTVHIERRQFTADDRANYPELRTPYISSADIRDGKGRVVGSVMVRPSERSDAEIERIANAWAAALNKPGTLSPSTTTDR